MNRSLATWTVAFAVSAATAMGVVGLARGARADSTRPRDPAKLSEIDAELILNRIRDGDLVALQGNLDGARKHWKTARDSGSGYWPIHEALGDSMARHRLDVEANGEYETSIRIAAHQLGRAPAALHLKRAGLLVRMNRPEPALRHLIECGDPARLGGAMARILKSSPALLDLVKQAADTRDPRLWSLVAELSPDEGERASALGRYVRSVAPADERWVRRAIEGLRTARRLDEALFVAQSWAKAAPSNPAAYDTWGRLLFETGDRQRARLVLSTIVDVRPGDPEAHRMLGAALRDLGDYAEAMRQFEEVSRLRPEEPLGAQEIVATCVAKGDFAGAIEKYGALTARKWDSRFGDVAAGLRQKIADAAQKAIDAARAAGDRETVTKWRRWCGEIGIAEAGLFDIKIVMRWDAASDVDLDVVEPNGETVNHEHARSKSGAVYTYDNTQGRGPEHYTLLKAPSGKYRVEAHLHGGTPSVVDFEAILFEDTPRERRLTGQVRLSAGTSKATAFEFEIP